MNIINDDDIENFLNDIPSDGESFSGSEFDDSDNDKTYTPRITETVIHVSASSSDQGGSSDDECFYQMPTLPVSIFIIDICKVVLYNIILCFYYDVYRMIHCTYHNMCNHLQYKYIILCTLFLFKYILKCLELT